jgi:hypothetical protein
MIMDSNRREFKTFLFCLFRFFISCWGGKLWVDKKYEFSAFSVGFWKWVAE